MLKNRHHPVAAAILACACATLAMSAYAQTYHASGSGWSMTSDAADANQDMEGGSTSYAELNGSFGNATSSSRGDLLPWDSQTFCDFDDAGFPIAVELTYHSSSAITRFANGDLLFSRQSDSPASTLCFNFNDMTSTFRVYRDVIGGTGKFEGATGNTVTTGSATQVVEGHTGFEFNTTGTINRQKKH